MVATPENTESAGSAKESAPKPWVIAVTGGRGSGKTTLLAGLLDFLRREGRRPEGFIAEAEGRCHAGEGADRYTLRWPLSGEECVLCERATTGCPPYRFSAEAWRRVATWAAELEQGEPPEVLVLDEFGRLEARGEGLMLFWPAFLAARPTVIVMAIRAEVKEALELHIGQPFDLIVEATEEAALSRLCELCASARDWQRVGRFGAAAGGIEASLGALLHATKLPFRGLTMSGLQALVLYYAGDRLAQPWRVIWIAYVAAALKALSPAGNRLRPMLAIAMQGSLFGLSVRTLGWNFVGIQSGAWLVGVWAGLQGFVFQYLIMGRALLEAYGEVQAWIESKLGLLIPSLPLFVALYALASGCVVSTAVGVLRWRRRPPALLAKALDRPAPATATARRLSWRQRLWREYRSKAFWVPMVLVLVILALSGSPAGSLVALSLRIVGVIAAIFVILSVLKPERWTRHLRRRGLWGAALAMEHALSPRLQAVATNEQKDPR